MHWKQFKYIILASLACFLMATMPLITVRAGQGIIINVPEDYLTIQEAIDYASDGDVIFVAPGTYVENINFYGKIIVVQSQDGPLSTIITPANKGIPIVLFYNGETADAKLIGFTLKNARGVIAGGALNFGYRSHPTIENCIITDNETTIYFYYSGAVLKNCLISDNTTNLLFKFDANAYHPEMINCTIAGNKELGFHVHPDHPAPKFKNCIIYGNETGGVSGNFDISYSLVDGGFIGTGNIDADPLFVAAWNGDYHLQANSPCIDTGTAFGVPYSDIDGMSRPKGAGHDMGAYEAYLPVVLIPYTPDPTNDNTPTLDWWDVVGASTYTLQYSGQSDFSTYTEVTNITESTYRITDELSDGVWYWRVRALDSEGVAGWWTALDYFVVDTHVTLTIFAGTGGTTNPTPGSHTYDTGTEVDITATPEDGYRFDEWTGDVPEGHENDNPITITMDSDKSITANFIRQYTLSIAAGTGGYTNPAPNPYTYYIGEEVQIEAIPETNYRFSGWTGDVPSGHEDDNPITITMDSDKSITANFSAIPAAGDETGKKGVCFIATAAYGSSLHSYVRILRDFRDKYLMPSKLGRNLVSLYYKYSPFFAEFIAKHKALKIIVRINLLPIVAFSYLIVHFGPFVTSAMFAFIFMIPIFSVSFFRRKRRQVEDKNHKALASLD